MDTQHQTSGISHAKTDEAMGEFWGTHDLTDFDDRARPDAEFEVMCAVPIEESLFAEIEQQAHKRGVQIETLVNLWLQQKLGEQVKQI